MRTTGLVIIALLLLAAPVAAQEWREVARPLESPHPYPDSANQVTQIQVEGARAIRVHFERLDMEEDYDTVTLSDARGNVIETLTGARENFWSKEIPGDRVLIRIRSDESMSFWGFKIDRYQYLPPVVVEPPPPPPPPVVESILARIECQPADLELWEGQRAVINVRGFDRRNRPVPPASLDVFFNVFGAGVVLRTNRPGQYEYRAPRDVAEDLPVTLRAFAANDGEVRAEVEITVRRRPRITALLLVPQSTEIEAGEAVTFRITGRTRDPKARPELTGWPLRVWHEGPGRIEPMRMVGLYRYISDPNIRGDQRVILRAALKDNARIAIAVPVTVRPRVNLVDLEVSAEPNLVAPGEAVELTIRGVGDRGDRRPSLAGKIIDLTVEVKGGRRARTQVLQAPPGKSTDAIRWTWTAPGRIQGRVEVLFRAVLRGRPEVKGKDRVIVARPITSLAVVGSRPRVRAGDTVEFRVEGRTDGDRRPVDVPASRIRVTLDGPGRIQAVGKSNLYRYLAPRQVNGDTPVTIRAQLLRNPRVAGAASLTVRPRVNLVAIEVRTSRDRLLPGEEAEVTIVPRGDHPKIALSADDITLELAARGGTLRRVRPGTWLWKAPADIKGRREFFLRARAPEDPKIVGHVRLLVSAAGVPANQPIDTEDLFVITEWKFKTPVLTRTGPQPMPKDGVFRGPAREITFKGRIMRSDVRSIAVALTRQGSEKVRMYTAADDNLRLERNKAGHWVFRFKKEFSHRKKKYTVNVLVTTSDGTTYRDVFHVKPK